MKNEKIFLKKIKPEMTDCRVMQIEKLEKSRENKEKQKKQENNDVLQSHN